MSRNAGAAASLLIGMMLSMAGFGVTTWLFWAILALLLLLR